METTTQKPTAQRVPQALVGSNRLVRHGFEQGEKDGNQSGECDTCDKTVTRNRAWFWQTSIEYDEWDCYCKKCALARVDADETMWALYAEPNKADGLSGSK